MGDLVVFMCCMKIRFLQTTVVDVETKDGQEVYGKCFSRWQEVRVDEIYPAGNFATVKLENGDLAVGVPVDSFERLQEEKKTVTI